MKYNIIFDKELWNQASDVDRQEVVNHLMENKLKNVFEFQGFKEFSCNDLKNIIAIFKHIDTQMNFHLIPGGTFYFGAGKNLPYIKKNYSIDISENFNELVTISPFLMSSYLVTEYAWNKFEGKKLHFNFGDNHPIDVVNRDDVTNWAKKIGARLPSDTEWECLQSRFRYNFLLGQ